MRNWELYLMLLVCCAVCAAAASLSAPFSDRVNNARMETIARVSAAKAAKRHGVPFRLIMAVIEAESSLNHLAISPKGAMGLMQLMPITAREMGVSDPFDPAQSISGGTAYLAKMYKRFNRRWDLALAAYNAGPQRVIDHGGIPPFPETQNYVAKVLKRAGIVVESPL